MDWFAGIDVTQALIAMTGVIITGLGGWAAKQIERRTGYEMDARARETLHSALNTGAMIALSHINNGIPRPDTSVMVDTVLKHVLGDGAVDAVQRLQPARSTLRALAQAKLVELEMQRNPMVAVTGK